MQDQLFAQKAKALAGRETRTKKKGGKGPKVNERAYQYGTYDEFSYEAEKQRLLDSLVSS